MCTQRYRFGSGWYSTEWSSARGSCFLADAWTWPRAQPAPAPVIAVPKLSATLDRLGYSLVSFESRASDVTMIRFISAIFVSFLSIRPVFEKGVATWQVIPPLDRVAARNNFVTTAMICSLLCGECEWTINVTP